MKRVKGFTLIEMLVVIGIIGFFLLVFLPSMVIAKERSKETVCLNRQHRLGMAFEAYLEDNDNMFMGEWISIATSGGGHDIWVEALQPYYYGNEEKNLLCPAATETASEGAVTPYKAWEFSEDAPYGGVAGKRGSYMINWWVTDPYDYSREEYRDDPRSWKTDLVDYDPSCIPVIGGGAAVWRAFPDDTDRLPRWDGDEDWYAGVSMGRFSIDRHEPGYTNILFMDWSARKVGLKELWRLKWHREFDMANQYTLAGGMTPEQWPEWMRDFEDF